MKYKSILFFFILILGAVSCTIADPKDDSLSVSAFSQKILFTKSNASQTSLMVKFRTAPSMSELDEFIGKGIISISPMFTSVPGKERMEEEFGLNKWYEIKVSENLLTSTVSMISADDRISLVEYDVKLSKASDCIVYPAGQSYINPVSKGAEMPFNDPKISSQWNFKNTGSPTVAKTAYKGGDINVYDVWKSITSGDPSIIVAVVDEGVKVNHPDLSQNIWKNEAEVNGKDGVDDDGNGYIDDKYGYNFVSNGAITWDKDHDSGHGTHCAGIIAAVNNNSVGISSVAGGSGNNDGVRIMSCQIFDGNSGGSVSQSAKAIKYAADMGASIISCSFGYSGGTFMSDSQYKNYAGAEADAIAYFEATKNNPYLDGGIVVFASGNDGDAYATYPGAMADIISVSAFGPDFLPTYYTNYGPGCNIVAPGGEAFLPPFTSYAPLILSTVPKELYNDDYGYMQGTSMACPHVSGIAALGIARLKQLKKQMTASDFKEMLVTSANDFDTRIKGVKEYTNGTTLELYPFRKQMGTGSIDSWLFMMKLEGVPCILTECGSKQWVDLSRYFGSSSANLTYLSVEMNESEKQSLGLVEDPYIEYGRLFIHPTQLGSAKMTVKAVGGGTELGGDDKIGGMEISQEVSIIVRNFKSINGGWL